MKAEARSARLRGRYSVGSMAGEHMSAQLFDPSRDEPEVVDRMLGDVCIHARE